MEDYMKNVHILEHPLIAHKITHLCDVTTNTKEFREIVSEIAMLMGYEAFRDLPTTDVEIQAPLSKFKSPIITEPIAIVPILRAGLGMVDGVLSLIPAAKVGHIGMYRDPETHKPVDYYCKLPADLNERDVFVLDPMLATGGSAIDAVARIKEFNPKRIKFMCIIAAPEGIEAFTAAHPDVPVYCAGLDDHLNEHCYIVPGLGDAGDRIFGTK